LQQPGRTTTQLPFPRVPSGKKSKQARRAAALKPPPIQSKGAPRRRQANPRVLAIGAAVVVLAGIGTTLGVVFSGGGNSTKGVPSIGSLANGLPGASDVDALYKGIPQQGLTLGWPSAPVTLIQYIDLQCPFCQQFETQVMPAILQRYVRTKKVKIETRVLDFLGSDSSRGRDAMVAAAQQNKAYNFAELLYYNQGQENTGWLSDSMVAQAAASIPPLKVHELLAARSTAAVTKQGPAFDKQAAADKVGGTPTLYVGKSGTKGKLVPLSSPTDEQTLVTALDAALAA
jgi:protein-disulfide isomerase